MTTFPLCLKHNMAYILNLMNKIRKRTWLFSGYLYGTKFKRRHKQNNIPMDEILINISKIYFLPSCLFINSFKNQMLDTRQYFLWHVITLVITCHSFVILIKFSLKSHAFNLKFSLKCDVQNILQQRDEFWFLLMLLVNF